MCGRFYSDKEIRENIWGIAGVRDQDLVLPEAGDIYPSQQALILCGHQGKLYAETMHWGFPRFDGKGLLINARAETATEKKTFRDSVRHHRCIIAARHFYEWDHSKNKVTFQYNDKRPLYMAGLYQHLGEEKRFVILTTEANSSMEPVHDRMPLILPEVQLAEWICCKDEALNMLKQQSPLLESFRQEEQQTLQLMSK